MNAGREAFLADLLYVLGRLRADNSIPLPKCGTAAHPFALYAPDGCGREGLEAIAASLRLEDTGFSAHTEEDGWPWIELTGHRGEVHVRISADDGAVLLDPLPELAVTA